MSNTKKVRIRWDMYEAIMSTYRFTHFFHHPHIHASMIIRSDGGQIENKMNHLRQTQVRDFDFVCHRHLNPGSMRRRMRLVTNNDAWFTYSTFEYSIEFATRGSDLHKKGVAEKGGNTYTFDKAHLKQSCSCIYIYNLPIFPIFLRITRGIKNCEIHKDGGVLNP